MRYWLNVYWTGSVYLDLCFYTAWARSRRSNPRSALWNTTYASEKWVVGDEYDEVAFARLKRALDDLRYAVRDQWNCVAGSQDIHQWAAVGPGGQLTIESETFVGLSVEGPVSLIADLQAQYERPV